MRDHAVSTEQSDALRVCREAIRRGLIPPAERDSVLTLVESLPEGRRGPQTLVERGILTPDELQALLTSMPTVKGCAPGAGAEETPPPQAHAPQAAALFGDDYELAALLGQGGMGQVYKAWQRSLRRLVALKIIRPASGLDEEAVRRFHVEAQAAARLHHPHIVPVYQFGVHEGQLYYTMELVEGAPLSDVLRAGKLTLKDSLNLMEKVARAVHHAHVEGIIHRDLKPGNILVDARGEPRITDFGLAKDLGTPAEISQSGAALGTPAYMSPEQAQGRSRQADARSDVYSLGCILYEMLTGRPPFHAPSMAELLWAIVEEEPLPPRRLSKSTPADAQTICLKCLAKEPARRYQTAGELADDLHRYLAGEPITARPSSVFYRVTKRVLRHKLAAAAGAAAALLALALGITLAIQAHRTQRRRAALDEIRASVAQHLETLAEVTREARGGSNVSAGGIGPRPGHLRADLQRALEEAEQLKWLLFELPLMRYPEYYGLDSQGPQERLAHRVDAVILQLARDEEKSTKLVEVLRALRFPLARVHEELGRAVGLKGEDGERSRLTADLGRLLEDLKESAALLQRRADEAGRLRQEFREILSVLSRLYEGAKREGILNVDEAGLLPPGKSHWRLLGDLFRPAQASFERLGRAQDDLKRFTVTRENALLLRSLQGLEQRLAEVQRRATAILDASRPKGPPKAAPPQDRDE